MKNYDELLANPNFHIGLGLLGGRGSFNNVVSRGLLGGTNNYMLAQEMLANKQAQQQAAQQAMQQQQARQQVFQQMGMPQSVATGFPSLADKLVENSLIPQTGNPTDDMREYQQAVAQGYQGSFMDYMREIKAAGAIKVNTAAPLMPTDEQIRADDMKARAKDAREYTQGLVKLGFEGHQNILNYDRMIKLLDTAETGFGQETLMNAKRMASALGIDIDTTNIASGEQLMTLLGDEVMKRVAQTKGAVSEKEMELFRIYSANYGNTTEGNRKILQFKKAKAQRDIRIANLIRKLQKEGKTSVDIESAVWDFVSENDLSGMLEAPGQGIGQSRDLQNAAMEEMKRRGMR